jgi:hypothetical protein
MSGSPSTSDVTTPRIFTPDCAKADITFASRKAATSHVRAIAGNLRKEPVLHFSLIKKLI